MMVMLAFKILAGKIETAKNTYVVYGGDRKQVLLSESIEKRNPECPICSNTYLSLQIPETKTLETLIELVTKELGLKGEISVQNGEQYSLLK